jgi:hypothetical protein
MKSCFKTQIHRDKYLKFAYHDYLINWLKKKINKIHHFKNNNAVGGGRGAKMIDTAQKVSAYETFLTG